ncbi:hypothetical protein NBRC116493_35460 [Aurantivibrio infirmus]
MTSLNNCHSLFKHDTKPSFLDEIKLNDTDDEALKNARHALMEIIKRGFDQHRDDIVKQNLKFELPSPRFYTQGSYAYKTIIDPAYPPDQQVDLDLGVYLPFETLLSENSPPSESAKTYFNIICGILEQHQIPFKVKNTCVRINLSNRLHVDLPLYGVPANKFKQILESFDAQKVNLRKGLVSDIKLEKLDPTCIHLAMNDGSWKPSDPKEIREWMEASCSSHGMGNQVRSICKYLKAWRDEKWRQSGGPSSIFLLACVIHNYRHVNGHHHDLLREVINALPKCLNRPVLVPAPIPGDENHQEDLRDRISSEEKIQFQSEFDQLYRQYDLAMTTLDTQLANQTLCSLFGSRFPFDPPRIVRLTPLTPGGKVKETPAKVAPLLMGAKSSGG